MRHIDIGKTTSVRTDRRDRQRTMNSLPFIRQEEKQEEHRRATHKSIEPEQTGEQTKLYTWLNEHSSTQCTGFFSVLSICHGNARYFQRFFPSDQQASGDTLCADKLERSTNARCGGMRSVIRRSSIRQKRRCTARGRCKRRDISGDVYSIGQHDGARRGRQAGSLGAEEKATAASRGLLTL